MGGWISLLVGSLKPKRVAAFIGIAAAPDFTETSMWANLNQKARNELNKFGKVKIESEYSDRPYIITKKLIEDGRLNLIMNSPLASPFPIRLLQGMLDKDVHYSQAISLAENIIHNDVKVTICKDADHQFSSPACLDILTSTIQEFL
jgi:pimeloyl-ACP methyl ester carboxylesterase